MTFDLFAHVSYPQPTIASDGEQQFISPVTHYRRVFIDNYDTKAQATTAVSDLTQVFLDDDENFIAPIQSIIVCEIVEIP